MHGQMAQAADACTLGFGFFKSDHNNLTPSKRSIILFLKRIKNKFNFNNSTTQMQTNAGHFLLPLTIYYRNLVRIEPKLYMYLQAIDYWYR